MIDRADAEAVLYRAAIAALGYWPTKHLDEPGYTIDEDIDWCLGPIGALDGLTLQRVRARVRAVIADPTAAREEFRRALAELVGE